MKEPCYCLIGLNILSINIDITQALNIEYNIIPYGSGIDDI